MDKKEIYDLKKYMKLQGNQFTNLLFLNWHKQKLLIIKKLITILNMYKMNNHN